MKRILLGLTVSSAIALVQAATAQDLWIGDAAPAINATQWFQGDAIDPAAAKDKKVLVVEFWATWCGPCIASMPHLTELQHKYADNVVVIGVTKPDDNGNTLESVTKFLADNREKLAYRVAFDGDKKTYESYMKAAGQRGIPTAFIVDKTGAIAWIGHPMNMDGPLAEVVAGTHDIDRTKLVKSLQKRGFKMKQAGNWEQSIRSYKALSALEPDNPNHWDDLSSLYAYNLKWPGKTKEAAQQALRVGQDDAAFLASYSGFLAGRDEAYDCQKLALQAARRSVELDAKASAGHLALIRALTTAGQTEEARTHGAKAIGLLTDAADLTRMADALARTGLEAHDLALKAARRAVDLDSESTGARLALIRALASTGEYSGAMAAARETIDLLADDAKGLARLANALARPELEGRCGALALEAIESALTAEPEKASHVQTKFRILALCQKDIKSAEGVGRYAVEVGGDSASFLNNFAWSALTDDGLKGQFNELALAAAQRCHELSEGKSWMYLDTLALAKFETGAKREAMALQSKAIELATDLNIGGSSMTDLQDALARYKESQTETLSEPRT